MKFLRRSITKLRFLFICIIIIEVGGRVPPTKYIAPIITNGQSSGFLLAVALTHKHTHKHTYIHKEFLYYIYWAKYCRRGWMNEWRSSPLPAFSTPNLNRKQNSFFLFIPSLFLSFSQIQKENSIGLLKVENKNSFIIFYSSASSRKTTTTNECNHKANNKRRRRREEKRWAN